MSAQINNIRPEFDREIVDIVDYVMNYEISSQSSLRHRTLLPARHARLRS